VRTSKPRVVAALFALLLGGWFSDQHRQFDECAKPDETGAPSSDSRIEQCMIDHGYRRDFKGGQCPAIANPAHDALCYEPRNSAASILFKIEMLVRPAR